jgi:hypothetical protein
MGTADSVYFRMFSAWPANVFKPASHICAKWNEMYVSGVGLCKGYKGTVLANKTGEQWAVHLSDGAIWAYRTTDDLLMDWRIARTFDEYIDIRRAMAERPQAA